MEIKQLEYFRQIASTGSINEAARRLNMSQPPLSYQMKQLEEELQVTLFERTRTGVILTEAGKLLYERSENLLDYIHSTELEVAKAGKKQVLRIGITPTTVSTIMPYISEFSKKNPDVNFEVRDGITYVLYNYLMDGIIDVSVARTPIRLEGAQSLVLGEEPMIAVYPSGMCCEKNNRIRLENLVHNPLILYRRYEELIMNAFSARNLHPNILCICDDPRDGLEWVKEGLAVAIFPQSMKEICEGMKKGLKIRLLNEKALKTRILLIWKKGKKLSRLVQSFLDICSQADEKYI
ncbi:MAG: LysR family transcriptional regulator [Blautia sp.]|nr:LysR family transcriptional regulator [Blautia sp.]